MDNELIIALVAAGSVIVGGLITYYGTRELNKASAMKAITDCTVNLLGPLNKKVDELESKTDSLQKENDRQKKITARIRCALKAYAERNAYLLHGINVLISQVMKHEETPNFVPVEWFPPEVDEDD